MRACTGGTCSAPNYFLTDHLGSVDVVLDANGTVLSQQRYLPFGGERTDIGNITQTDFGYTSQREMDSGMGGLMDYRARMYSPLLGRFIQPDTIIPGAANPQAYNRYSYVLNNPIRFNDPTGHMCREDGKGCDGSMGGGVKIGDKIIRESEKVGGSKGNSGHSGRGGGDYGSRHDNKKVTGVPPVINQGLLNPYIPPVDLLDIPAPTMPNSPSNSTQDEDFITALRYGKVILSMLQTAEVAFEYGRPVYKQVKYLGSFGPFEYGADGLLQLYDDRNMDLTTPQHLGRGLIRGLESAFIDGISQGVGGIAAIAVQVNVPIPLVSAGVGYAAGAYSTSKILDTWVTQKNPEWFSNNGLGGP